PLVCPSQGPPRKVRVMENTAITRLPHKPASNGQGLLCAVAKGFKFGAGGVGFATASALCKVMRGAAVGFGSSRPGCCFCRGSNEGPVNIRTQVFADDPAACFPFDVDC